VRSYTNAAEFVERGLLEQADDESELAGVLAHEIGHDVARHAHKLMKKATIADIFFQGAEIAALILTGGAVGIGTYYALQYGFYGLGLVLDLKLLGVSREYELEADQLGIQYTWNTGYDPSGFVRFFDKMATQEGCVNGVGWFYDHPPFYQRMVDAERETMFLPERGQLAEQTSAFEQMKKELMGVKQQADKEEKDKPSLLLPEKGCPAPPADRVQARHAHREYLSVAREPDGGAHEFAQREIASLLRLARQPFGTVAGANAVARFSHAMKHFRNKGQVLHLCSIPTAF
jgi:predicted Zn-dependent protease